MVECPKDLENILFHTGIIFFTISQCGYPIDTGNSGAPERVEEYNFLHNRLGVVLYRYGL